LTNTPILRLATRALVLLMPRHQRESILGDLAEEHALREKSDPSSARKWYWSQLISSIPPLAWARFAHGGWPIPLGIAVLAYAAVGAAELAVNWAIVPALVSTSDAYSALGMLITFPIVVLIGFLAERWHRGAALALGAMMFAMVLVMTVTSAEQPPLWYRIAYFVVGPAASLIGRRLTSARDPRS
jgi:hypothetical protein